MTDHKRSDDAGGSDYACLTRAGRGGAAGRELPFRAWRGEGYSALMTRCGGRYALVELEAIAPIVQGGSQPLGDRGSKRISADASGADRGAAAHPAAARSVESLLLALPQLGEHSCDEAEAQGADARRSGGGGLLPGCRRDERIRLDQYRPVIVCNFRAALQLVLDLVDQHPHLPMRGSVGRMRSDPLGSPEGLAVCRPLAQRRPDLPTQACERAARLPSERGATVDLAGHQETGRAAAARPGRAMQHRECLRGRMQIDFRQCERHDQQIRDASAASKQSPA
jgi:hypothetical protein